MNKRTHKERLWHAILSHPDKTGFQNYTHNLIVVILNACLTCRQVKKDLKLWYLKSRWLRPLSGFPDHSLSMYSFRSFQRRKNFLLLLPVITLFMIRCEIPTEVYDNPLDMEAAEEEGIEPPALVFFPDSTSATVGSNVSVQVFALEVEGLAGSYIQIKYDKNKLSLSSLSLGEFFQSATEPVFFYEDDASAGTINIYSAYLGTDSVSISGTGDLASLVFNATSPGRSTLTYTTACELVGPDDTPIEIKGFGAGVIDAR